jgi:hypothetical protein
MVLSPMARLSAIKSAGKVLLRHEAIDLVRLPQIEISPQGKHDVAILALEPPHDGGARHAGVPGHEDTLAA